MKTNDFERRLADCFQAALPQLQPADIQKASMTSVPDWDSMVTITLVSLIEESFGVQTEPEEIAHFTSFQSIRDYLEKKAAVCDVE